MPAFFFRFQTLRKHELDHASLSLNDTFTQPVFIKPTWRRLGTREGGWNRVATARRTLCGKNLQEEAQRLGKHVTAELGLGWGTVSGKSCWIGKPKEKLVLNYVK